MVNKEKNVCKVMIKLPENFKENKKKHLAVLINELLAEEINILDVAVISPSLCFFFKEKDFMKAHQVLFNVCNSKKT